jgi:hypothetical protein
VREANAVGVDGNPMKQTKPTARPSAVTIIAALLAGLVVLLALFPAGGVVTDPPECYALLFYAVPCEAQVAWAVAIATAGLVGVPLWMIHRRR